MKKGGGEQTKSHKSSLKSLLQTNTHNPSVALSVEHKAHLLYKHSSTSGKQETENKRIFPLHFQPSLTDSRKGLQLTPLIIYALTPFPPIYFYPSPTGSHTAAAGPLS